MSKVGDYLRQLRNEKGISQADVFKMTGITNSRLSKAENGADNTLNPAELKKLATIYEAAVIPIYIKAGYLELSDLEEYRSGFKGIEFLDEDEKEYIQYQIDFINRRKGK